MVARVPYISRKIATFDVLSEEGLCLIEENADRILRDVGMEFTDDPEILDLFRDAGADVQGTRVRFEPGHPRSIVQATAPSSFTQHARNPQNSVVLGGNNTVLRPSWGPPFIHNLDEGRRYATLADFNDLVTYADLMGSYNANNRGAFASKEYDYWLTVLQASVDPVERFSAAAKLQDIITEEVPILPTAETGSAYLLHPRLRGVIRRVIGQDPDFTHARVLPER